MNADPRDAEHQRVAICLRCGGDVTADGVCRDCGEGRSAPSTVPPENVEALESPQPPRFQPGAAFGRRYTVVEEVGSGGMGRVYKALDRETRKTVALKLVRPEIAVKTGSLDRFRKELTLAQEVTHANVCRVHDLGAVDEVRYISMEYVDGQTLRDFMQAVGRLSPRQTVAIARQIAAGLDAVHKRSIVHRDLKPGNIMLDRSGRAVVMDFGLAYQKEQERPRTDGKVLGTLAYLSPEQARGEPTDTRSDLYSLGLVLFEMLTGRCPPADGKSVPLALRDPKDRCPKPSELAPDVPPSLDGVLLRCLERERENRFQSASELDEALARVAEELDSRTAPKRKRVRSLTLAAASLALVAGVAALYFSLAPPRSARGPHYLEVKPFKDLSGGQDYFSEGNTEAVLTLLMQHEGIHVVPASREIGARLALDGSASRTSDRVRLTYRLSRDAEPLAAGVVDGGMEEIFALQDRLVSEVSRALEKELGLRRQTPEPAPQTADVEAYALYLQAKNYLRRYEAEGNVDIALDLFRKALKRDARYALAQAGICESSWRKYEATKDVVWVDRAVDACKAAASLDPKLAEVQVALGTIYRGTGRLDEARRAFDEAIAKNPKSDEAHLGIAAVFEGQNKIEEAEKTFLRAIELRPDYWSCHSWLGAFYFKQGRYADAEAAFKKVIDLTPDNARGYYNLGGVYAHQERFAEATAMFERSLLIRPAASTYTNLGTTYFWQGLYTQALQNMHKAIDLGGGSAVLWGNLADCYELIPGLASKAPAAYRQAIALAERELGVNSKDAELRASLGLYRAHVGEKKKALLEINEALLLAPQNVNVIFTAALVHEVVGDREQALADIASAIERGYSRELLAREPTLAKLRKDPRYSRIPGTPGT